MAVDLKNFRRDEDGESIVNQVLTRIVDYLNAISTSGRWMAVLRPENAK